jgi:hypothetical protein
MPVRIIGMIGVAPPTGDASLHVIEGGISPAYLTQFARAHDAAALTRLAEVRLLSRRMLIPSICAPASPPCLSGSRATVCGRSLSRRRAEQRGGTSSTSRSHTLRLPGGKRKPVRYFGSAGLR